MKPRRKSKRRGASAVEMAFVAPVFVMLVLGIIESSRLGMVAQLLTTAAREGCRVAIIDGKAPIDVQNQIKGVLSGSGISVETVTQSLSPDTWASSPEGTAITVSLRVPYSKVSWLPTPFFFKNATISVSATMSSERPPPLL